MGADVVYGEDISVWRSLLHTLKGIATAPEPADDDARPNTNGGGGDSAAADASRTPEETSEASGAASASAASTLVLLAQTSRYAASEARFYKMLRASFECVSIYKVPALAGRALHPQMPPTYRDRARNGTFSVYALWRK